MLKIFDAIISIIIYIMLFFVYIFIDIFKNADRIIHEMYNECVKIKKGEGGVFHDLYKK